MIALDKTAIFPMFMDVKVSRTSLTVLLAYYSFTRLDKFRGWEKKKMVSDLAKRGKQD